MTSETKELIEYAASLGGETVSAFATRVLTQYAEETISSQHVIRLSAEDSLAFAQALFESTEPNDELIRAAADYWAWVDNVERD